MMNCRRGGKRAVAISSKAKSVVGGFRLVYTSIARRYEMRIGLFRRSLGTVLVVLTIAAMLGSACGPSEAPPSAPAPAPPTPGGNQPPVISSLTAAQMQIYPNGNTEIQCVAMDADGDRIDFKWACTGGSFTGAGPTVTWKAPEHYGTFDISVTVEDGKGGMAQASVTLTVGANQPPLISSLSGDPSGVLYGGTATITCIASDPDGDVVRYSWSASEGTISGVGEKVTWKAPNKGGDFNITVLVSDGKGGETTGNVMVVVSAATRTITINPVAQETGTVDSDGDKDTSRTMAGDDDKNIGYCAFWSFDIYSLVGSKIDNAKLKFTTRSVANNPFPSTTGLGGLRLWQVTYGDKLPKFWYTGTKLHHAQAVLLKPPTEIDVTPDVNHLVQAAATRFQVEALFMRKTNGNGVAERIEWSDVVLEVTYSEK